ncbi:Y-family DNA polymerase [Mammaliicoccus fleurettii]|uniref:Y-family DNA polymerase n=2 Tax=Mammaliicoccus fleurettii TaxID=150056 RepID=UPI00099215C2|nr:DNA repair protein [Mammaliicoccus fleurettii]MEB7723276.1 DNA repair protein [Mammaliicoccus fleurettii]MEB8067166.1 DNA repair protein [Mammaliicoccus fleurettii]
MFVYNENIFNTTMEGDFMYDYRLYEKRHILCIDQNSFFANVSCMSKGINPDENKLAVISDTKRKGAIILSATEPLKKLGIDTGARLFEIPQRNDIYIINPNMNQYINQSIAIYKILLKYVEFEDIQQYNVEEIFIDITKVFKYYCSTPFDFASMLKREIEEQMHMKYSIGIGPNMFLSKSALDIEAKNNKQLIAEWKYEDIPSKLWPIHPLNKMWGINQRVEKDLNEIGIYTVGDLAHYPLKKLEKSYGEISQDLHLNSNGIDLNKVQDIHNIIKPKIKYNLKLSQNYQYFEMKSIILETVESLTKQLRSRNLLVKTISFSLKNDQSDGISKEYTLKDGTNIAMDIFRVIWSFSEQLCDKAEKYNELNISLNNFVPERARELNMFIEKFERLRNEGLELLINEINWDRNLINDQII